MRAPLYYLKTRIIIDEVRQQNRTLMLAQTISKFGDVPNKPIRRRKRSYLLRIYPLRDLDLKGLKRCLNLKIRITYKEVQGLFYKGGVYPHRINPDCGSFVAK